MDQIRLDEICYKWNLKLEGKIKDTATSKIVFVTQNDTPFVLKIMKDNSDEFLSAKILQQYKGNGAVRVIDSLDDCILLERAICGKHLKELCIAGNDKEATAIFCDIVKKLHNSPKNYSQFPSIVTHWGKGFDKYLDSCDRQLPYDLVKDAKDIFFNLANSQKKQILIHGDLHHDNIILDERRGWLAIDPKGIIGEAEIEVSAFLKNPIGHSDIYANDANISRRIDFIADRLDLDKLRIVKWCYALTVLSCIWLVEVNKSPEEWLKLSNKLLNLLKYS